jgi:hypothetical protein
MFLTTKRKDFIKDFNWEKNIWTSTNSEFVESEISFLNDIAKKPQKKPH